ncbi:hypothetical protein BDZ89DRAFT_950122 [Hymenopellis radicata]|nr:hypothetical protein BDZ89DRAFT_950122 [Hymenopellis radicata]
MADFDLCRYWQVGTRHPRLFELTASQKKRSKFPLLYRIALDIPPIRASAVPCERVFASSKETDTLGRSRLKLQWRRTVSTTCLLS